MHSGGRESDFTRRYNTRRKWKLPIQLWLWSVPLEIRMGSLDTLVCVKARTPPGKMSTKVCNHEKWVDFQHWNSAYYQPRYMEGRMGKYYPKICKKCDKTFVSKSKTDSTFDPQNEFKVTNNQVVHVCPNATKDNHCCSYAVCQDCHSQIISM